MKTTNMTTFYNYTPHSINLNNGTTYVSLGVARVDSQFTSFDKDGICTVKYEDVQGLPDPKPGVKYIVSSMVLNALKGKRNDLVAPATGHPDCVRNDKGQIVSVPGFVC